MFTNVAYTAQFKQLFDERAKRAISCYLGKKGENLSFVSKWVTVLATERIFQF